jgi:hypothetical protein
LNLNRPKKHSVGRNKTDFAFKKRLYTLFLKPNGSIDDNGKHAEYRERYCTGHAGYQRRAANSDRRSNRQIEDRIITGQ